MPVGIVCPDTGQADKPASDFAPLCARAVLSRALAPTATLEHDFVPRVGAPPWARGGGSSCGPAGLPVIEIGLTVRRREHGKAHGKA